MSIREQLTDLFETHGFLTPELVVQAATPDHSSLHDYFEWDDSIAGPSFRLVQAGRMIRSVKISIDRGDDQPARQVRAFIARHTLTSAGDEPDGDESPVGQYVPVKQVIENELTRSAWFRSLQRDWVALRNRAGACQEFADLVMADVQTMRESA